MKVLKRYTYVICVVLLLILDRGCDAIPGFHKTAIDRAGNADFDI